MTLDKYCTECKKRVSKNNFVPKNKEKTRFESVCIPCRKNKKCNVCNKIRDTKYFISKNKENTKFKPTCVDCVDTKYCISCHRHLNKKENFSPNNSEGTTFKTYCIECSKIKRRKPKEDVSKYQECKSCQLKLPNSDFEKLSSGGYRGTCKACRVSQRKELRSTEEMRVTNTEEFNQLEYMKDRYLSDLRFQTPALIMFPPSKQRKLILNAMEDGRGVDKDDEDHWINLMNTDLVLNDLYPEAGDESEKYLKMEKEIEPYWKRYWKYLFPDYVKYADEVRKGRYRVIEE